MSQQPSRRRQQGRNPRRARKPAEEETLFRVVPAPDELPAVEAVARPTAFIESLDAMPLRGTHFMKQYVAAVVERAAGFALALAAAAQLDAAPAARDLEAPEAPDESEGEAPSN